MAKTRLQHARVFRLPAPVAAVDMLTTAPGALSTEAIAAGFRQGRRILRQVEAVLASLFRTGQFGSTPDGSRTFLRHRAA